MCLASRQSCDRFLYIGFYLGLEAVVFENHTEIG